ncbi:cyclohexyl-isocyanide hydratase [Pseudoxanthobacter soli DSM 19599]|uniref:Cyclohexyl-isocyanide hydratase n=1 Tax=Pseudoxanthobacter soli DSM 19599 TaxID=1123029 RepID=A0A1M7Z8W1_9HYPH|nr:DJ-1/PfpI family protein [Pseudoxanthobacter soli]SHO61373.1 cyclohexyl-isocyanide hydratase [Pseudoxanthobacter soli DSM 19599]
MPLRFGLVAFPGVQLLDLAGPCDVFSAAPDTEVHILWKDPDPVISSCGLPLIPTTIFADCPPLDVLCVPGGAGVNALLVDEDALGFVRRQAATARYVTSVCTGAMVLGAAGLLHGKRATTHWNALDFLDRLGAIPVEARVVRDGNLITAGGVTAGIDFGLTVIAELLGREQAEAIQLALEYAPAPPFSAGTPAEAPRAVVESVRAKYAALRAAREKLLPLA